MEHVVFYPSIDGTPAFRRVSALEDAVKFVEHLRNSEGTTEFSVHALAEVPLTLRAYYRVELPAQADSEPAEPAPGPDAAAFAVSAPSAAVGTYVMDAAPDRAAVPDADVEATVAEVPLGDSQEVVPIPAGRRSMGFFARS